MAAVTLTTTLLRLAELAPGKRKRRFFDDRDRGLIGEVRQEGVTFYCRYRDLRGRTKEYRIGRLGVITLEQARRKAREIQARASLGDDPAAERNALRNAITVAAFADNHYLPAYAEKRPRSVKNLPPYLARIKRKFGSKALDEIGYGDVADLKASLVREGLAPGTVNRHLATLRHMFNQAKRSGLFKGDNPAAAPGMLQEHGRESYLSDKQERSFITVLGIDRNRGGAIAIGLLMVTGARKSEITKAEWRNVDFDRCELLVPLSKSGKPRRIPLSPQAIALLREQRRRCAADERYVFPGTVPGMPIEDLRRIWARLKKAAGLPSELRIHDLRHSMASRLVNSGVAIGEVSVILGHSNIETTKIYTHYDRDRLAATAAKASLAWTTLPDET